MNYTPSDKIDPKEYEYIVSLGNKCTTTDTLRKLGIRTHYDNNQNEIDAIKKNTPEIKGIKF